MTHSPHIPTSSPLSIMRRGLRDDGTVGVVDDLTLSYYGNLLTRVDDIADPVSLENSLDFKGPSRTYGYDYDGRLRATYRYSATGAKLSSAVAETLYTSPTATRYYIGPMEFMQTASDTEPRLERVNLPWGYIDASGQPYRYIADHQGNIRAVIDRNGAIEQTTDYYPYGLPMATSTGAEVNPYKYGGKEWSAELQSYDFFQRTQVPAYGLFTSPDPKARSFCSISPYSYCAANPIRNIDLYGDSVRATTRVSGQRLIDTINETFKGSRYDELRKLFSLDTDGITLKSINKADFKKAITNLSRDEKILAYGYFKAINSTDMHLVEMVKSSERLSTKAIKTLGIKSIDKIINKYGGALNEVTDDGSISVIVIDSNKPIQYYNEAERKYVSKVPDTGESLAHELLGHGVSRSSLSSNSISRDAIQMSNLYLRVKGHTNYYRNGIDHEGHAIFKKQHATAIPSHFEYH